MNFMDRVDPELRPALGYLPPDMLDLTDIPGTASSWQLCLVHSLRQSSKA